MSSFLELKTMYFEFEQNCKTWNQQEYLNIDLLIFPRLAWRRYSDIICIHFWIQAK